MTEKLSFTIVLAKLNKFNHINFFHIHAYWVQGNLLRINHLPCRCYFVILKPDGSMMTLSGPSHLLLSIPCLNILTLELHICTMSLT
jgi:hypothetical protein